MLLRSKKQLPGMARSNQGIGGTNAACTSDMANNPPNSQIDTQIIPTTFAPSTGAPASTVAPSATHASFSSGTVASVVNETIQAIPTGGNTSNQGLWNFGKVSHRSVPPSRPTTSMLGLHTSQASSAQNLHAQLPPTFTPGVATTFPTFQQTLTNNSLAALRQQMEESNHEMVNMVTQQIGTIINPLIRDTNSSYQMLTSQMSV